MVPTTHKTCPECERSWEGPSTLCPSCGAVVFEDRLGPIRTIAEPTEQYASGALRSDDYPEEALERDILALVGRLRALRQAKGHDYCSSNDCLENLRPFGTAGVVIRIGDKFHRLKSFVKKGIQKVKDEKITDTMDDLVNYAMYLRIMWEQEKGATK